MTHSLHRRGSVESLQSDFVMINRTSKKNKTVTAQHLPEVAEIIFEAGANNFGSSVLETNVPLGVDREDFKSRIAGAHGFLCSFSRKEQLKQALTQLKEKNFGLSVTVSGLIDEVIPLAQELGIKPHTINLSLGLIGNTANLPEEATLELTTMCGHAMIAANLAKKGIADVQCGAKTPREAAMMMGRPCVCGIFNLDRADLLIARESEKA